MAKSHQNPDMRGRIFFPPCPRRKEDIYNSDVEPWLIACSLVGKYDRWQVNTYRKMYNILGDEPFRDIMEATRVIFVESPSISTPPAFLTHQFNLAIAGQEIYR